MIPTRYGCCVSSKSAGHSWRRWYKCTDRKCSISGAACQAVLFTTSKLDRSYCKVTFFFGASCHYFLKMPWVILDKIWLLMVTRIASRPRQGISVAVFAKWHDHELWTLTKEADIAVEQKVKTLLIPTACMVSCLFARPERELNSGWLIIPSSGRKVFFWKWLKLRGSAKNNLPTLKSDR